MSKSIDPTITLSKEEGFWIARDEATGVVSQGKGRHEALDNLEEALEGYQGAGRDPTEDELRAAGINPARNQSASLEESDIFD